MQEASSVAMITCFSAPRCLSTSLMYSFNSRPGTQVVDEPTYAHYVRTSGAQRPYMTELLAEQRSDGEAVLAELAERAVSTSARGGVIYVKNIAKLCTAPRGFMDAACETALLGGNGRAFVLVRDPRKVLRSWTKVLPASLEESGFPGVEAAFDTLVAKSGGAGVAVVDAEALAENPRATLQRLCATLGIDFDERMLSWPKGGIPEDGCWAPYWYANVHKSTCFEPPRKRDDEKDEAKKKAMGGVGSGNGDASMAKKAGGRSNELFLASPTLSTPERDAMMRECIRIYDKLLSSPNAIRRADVIPQQ